MKTTNEYHEQGERFLHRFGITFYARVAKSQTPPPWAKKNEDFGLRYNVTMKRPDGQTIRFPFWSSTRNRQNGIKELHPYSVLSAISGDVFCPEMFEEFCAEYGYDTDSVQALATFRRCSRFARELKDFFTSPELEDLSEIQ